MTATKQDYLTNVEARAGLACVSRTVPPGIESLAVKEFLYLATTACWIAVGMGYLKSRHLSELFQGEIFDPATFQTFLKYGAIAGSVVGIASFGHQALNQLTSHGQVYTFAAPAEESKPAIYLAVGPHAQPKTGKERLVGALQTVPHELGMRLLTNSLFVGVHLLLTRVAKLQYATAISAAGLGAMGAYHLVCGLAIFSPLNDGDKPKVAARDAKHLEQMMVNRPSTLV